ncbi:FAD-binding oxidoreductase [Microvirga lotononidis]|uniref:FAD/FMN-dependent dehydrogenase n=1 Tax=Microvirga lotononidis TaxID=864069 RepID=I4YQS2_9HYPH|nr:FAD-binding oxidoreductase [Microvirga lotononidis]EIM26314.1 FAD/FMN-dependent dehydrogenase [Microvirga lotononidis]WQO30686.1 FAD-binding oxidoreductase [Microvirga lotononidis]
MYPAADVLGPADVITDPAAMVPYLTDWRGLFTGEAAAVMLPRTAEAVAAVLRWASQTRTPVVPQGGNTGLSGGATPDASGRAVVLSLERLNRIRTVDPIGNTLIAEAGCILATVQESAAAAGREFPVSIGSEGSCQIGGILATNAGGIAVIRHGMTRDLVLGLEYVTAGGEIVRGPKRLRKNNAGYDLRHLLLGSEGTLAVITAAALRIVRPPPARGSALVAVASPDDALRLLRTLREGAGEEILAFELMCGAEMDLVRARFPQARYPLTARHSWYVFIEIGGECEASVSARLETALSGAFEAGTIVDAVIAATEAQAREIWHLRFAVSEANRLAGPTASHDVSVATEDVPALIAGVAARLGTEFSGTRALFVGHVGDGNIHVNVLFPGNDALAAQGAAVNAAVYALVHDLGGSISAEHGIGRLKSAVFARISDPVELRLMREIKQAFDPAGILNPGAVISAGEPQPRDAIPSRINGTVALTTTSSADQENDEREARLRMLLNRRS